MAKIDSDELDNKVGEVNRISKEQEQDALFVSMRDDGETHGRMETSASAAAKAANPDNDKNGKKKDKKDDLALHLLLLNEQIADLNKELDTLNQRIGAGNFLLGQFDEDGKLDLDDPEVQRALRILGIPEDEWSAINEDTIKDIIEADKLRKGDVENDLREKTELRAAEKLKFENNDTQNNVTTEMGNDQDTVRKVDELNGFNAEEQEEALDFFGDDAMNASASDAAMNLFSENPVTSATSFASTLDDTPPLNDKAVTVSFNYAAEGVEAPDAPSVTPDQTHDIKADAVPAINAP